MKAYEVQPVAPDNRGFIQALIGDGRPLLLFTGLSLILAGGFALFLAATGHFLPQDSQYLGMTADELCALDHCRILKFMIHDRAAFGGALIAIGMLYLWLAEFPLRQGEAWAWWLFAISGLLGFTSFLAYLSYGYLDTWHGLATLALLPVFGLGLVRSYSTLAKPATPRALRRPSIRPVWNSALGLGRIGLILTAIGMVSAGLTILTVGTSVIFVPQDLTFMTLQPADLARLNQRLIPLIAHDRAGFGGAILTTGFTALFAVWCGRPSRNLWQALALAGGVGFGTAIGIHPLVGYTNLVHLAPALLGALLFALSLALSYSPMMRAEEGRNRIDELLSHPLTVENFKPLTRAKIYQDESYKAEAIVLIKRSPKRAED